MKKEDNYFTNLIIRYIFLLLIGIFGLSIIYLIFTPLTIYPVYNVLNLFYNAALSNSSILINNYQIDLVEACIAGAAYYLLLILNFSVSMKAKQRIYSLIYSVLTLLILNILRIVILSVLFINNSLLFDFTHKVFWYGLSTVFVIAIWFSEVKFFKINSIPFYTDIINIKKTIIRK